jgi:hypothetical protein
MYERAEDQTLRPGVFIRERHRDGRERRVQDVVRGSHVIAVGVESGRRTMINWSSLGRYDVVEWGGAAGPTGKEQR